MSKALRTAIIAASLACLIAGNVPAAERRDPRNRDEDISAALLTVEYFSRADGLIEYVYRLHSPPSNKGIILDLEIDLGCEQAFAPVELPFPVGAEGYDFPPGNAAAHTPTAVIGDFGSSFSYGLNRGGSASWGLYMHPGEVREGLRLISPAPPGMRAYRLIPALDNDKTWNYPLEPVANLPWIDDFTVSGTIAAPGCPGVTPPPQ